MWLGMSEFDVDVDVDVDVERSGRQGGGNDEGSSS